MTDAQEHYLHHITKPGKTLEEEEEELDQQQEDENQGGSADNVEEGSKGIISERSLTRNQQRKYQI